MKTATYVPKRFFAYKQTIVEPCIFIAVFVAFFALFISKMGLANTFNTMINTAYRLLIDTAFYIMAICVLMGAISALFAEFGLIRLLDRLLCPLMKPIWGLPGCASLGILTAFLSDNPAILSLADNTGFQRYFKKYQFPALTNLGTAFGMGLIVCTYMLGLGAVTGQPYGLSVAAGLLGAIIGSIVSTRLMLGFTKRLYGKDAPQCSSDVGTADDMSEEKAGGNPGKRLMDAILSGGTSGVKLGLSVIPGVLIICTFVMMLTNGSSGGSYTGAAYEGIALLPRLADKLSFILRPLFGFTSGACISVPVTALGSAGAAISLIPALLRTGQAGAGDIAVFTAMCMCWSGYLSTHVSMMDSLQCQSLTGKAILCHTIGGIAAGASAHWLYVLLTIL